ncbi:hypothetical protein ACXWO4_10240, partial [Streptococcus pyogenes]
MKEKVILFHLKDMAVQFKIKAPEESVWKKIFRVLFLPTDRNGEHAFQLIAVKQAQFFHTTIYKKKKRQTIKVRRC